MLITATQTITGENGCYRAGRTYDVPEREGRELLKVNHATEPTADAAAAFEAARPPAAPKPPKQRK